MDLTIPKPAEIASGESFAILFDHYDQEDERRRESLLSLGNGVLHCRASAPEEPAGSCHYPGLYRAGCYARLTGRVESEDVSTDSLANLPSWLSLAVRFDGESETLSFDRVEILRYRQRLDFREAVLTRDVEFRDAQGRRTLFREERFLSMAAPHLGALRTRLTPLDWSGTVEIRSGIDAAVSNALAVEEGGYRPEALAETHLEAAPNASGLLARTRTLGTDVAIAVAARTRLSVEGRPSIEAGAASIAQVWRLPLEAGETLTVEKVGAVRTARDHAIGEPAEAALADLDRAETYEALRDEHGRVVDQLWTRCRIEAENENLARALGLHAFHLLQTASPHAPASDAGLPSRGWQEAYHGQIFWDETLSLPFLSLHLPEVVRSALLYRHRRLDAARARARSFGLDGALYPWRSGTSGEEETPEFQENPRTGAWKRDETHRQFHVSAAIAHNVWQYFLATRDVDFMAGYGAEMMIEVARMWASLAKPHPDRPGRLTIRGVVGPNEFHTRRPGAAEPGLNDNTYTNVMAAWTLLRAGAVLGSLPTCYRRSVEARLALSADEPERWADVAGRLHLPLDTDGLFLPHDDFDALEPFDLPAYERGHPGERIDWSLEAEGGSAEAAQVLKQAEFAMLAYLLDPAELLALLARLGAPSDRDTIRRTIETDLARTSHDSSLSDLVYAGALARLSPEHAWTIFRDAVHPDEKSGHSGTEKGVHLGAMAATLDIVQRIYLGIRPSEDALLVDPAPPRQVGRLDLHLLFRSQSVTVELADGVISLTADAANHEAVPLLLLGVPHSLVPGLEVTAELPYDTAFGGFRS